MKRKDSDEGSKRRTGNRKKTKQDTSDEEEDCAAVNCLRPNGNITLIIYLLIYLFIETVFLN
jgi:hypothetical protein